MIAPQLPYQSTSFIGRREEIIELCTLLNDPACRLLTLVGPGGIGKTRLALEVAVHTLDNFLNGVFFVSLLPLMTPDNMITTIANVLGFQFYQDDPPRQQLLDYLSERQLLLVMDNFEHLLEGVSLVAETLWAAPGVKVLATSRETLNLQEEWVWDVKGLSFPNGVQLDRLEDYDALKLFIERARRVRRDFSVDDDLESVVRICQLVEGMPLALELAASWCRALPCGDIADRIQQGLDFLASNLRNLPERHQSMRAVFDHWWALLTDEEQATVRKLSVFRGGFGQQAAEQVAGTTLSMLANLVDKSFVRVTSDGHYDIQELLRQYAEEKLETAGETETIHDAHKNHYADFMQEHAIDIKGRRQLEGLNELEVDFDNIRIAWNRAVEQADYDALERMMEGLALFCDMRARYQEGEDLFQRAVDQLSPLNTDVIYPTFDSLCVRWIQVWVLPERNPVPDIVRQQLTHILTRAQRHHEHETIGRCLWLQGELERIEFSFGAATSLYEQALTYYEQLDDNYYVGRNLRGIVYCLNNSGLADQEQTRMLNQKHLEVTRNLGDKSGLAHALLYDTACIDIDHETVPQRLQEAADIWHEMGDWKSRAITLLIKSNFVFLKGLFDEARQIESESRQTLEVVGWHHRGLLVPGLIAVIEEDFLSGRQLIESNLTLVCSPYSVAVRLLVGLSLAALALMDREEAEQHILSALQFVTEPFIPIAVAGCLPVAAVILAERGEPVRAVQLLGLAFTYADSVLMGWMKKWPRLTRLRADLAAELGPEVYQAAWERGKQLDLETVIQELLEGFRTDDDGEAAFLAHVVADSRSLPDPLSPRELEVMALIANGLTNREIANRLHISVNTVKKHINHIFDKLDVKTRVQAIVQAQQLSILR